MIIVHTGMVLSVSVICGFLGGADIWDGGGEGERDRSFEWGWERSQFPFYSFRFNNYCFYF